MADMHELLKIAGNHGKLKCNMQAIRRELDRKGCPHVLKGQRGTGGGWALLKA